MSKSLICREEFKDNIKGWLALNKHYHPHSKNKNIPISEVLDIIDSLPAFTKDDTSYTDGYKDGFKQALTDVITKTHALTNTLEKTIKDIEEV